MTVFDLLFLLLAFVSVVTLGAAAAAALTGHRARALGLLKTWALGFAAYMAVVAEVSLVLPRRVLAIGEPLCSDDWCLEVTGVETVPAGRAVSYRVGFRVFSRALRVWQREHGVSVYLTGADGRRYAPQPDPEDVPFDVLLGPGQSVSATRTFEVPAALHAPALVIRRESGFPIGWFIIGYETWFRRPAMVRLDARPTAPASPGPARTRLSARPGRAPSPGSCSGPEEAFREPG
jgi:hypothetical protein